MKQPIKVVMLPTDANYGAIEIDSANSNKLSVEAKNYHHKNPQHIYITVSQDVEPIKEGDWYYDKDKKSIGKCTGKDNGMFRSSHNNLHSHIYHARKIIATTDPKLYSIISIKQGHTRLKETKIYIPQLQQSFIKEFVANPNGEWEVEYETVTHNKSVHGFAPMFTTSELKLNQDCTVNITAVEEKVYSKYEVMEIAHNAFSAGSRRGYSQRSIMAGAQGTDEPNREDWIKENL